MGLIKAKSNTKKININCFKLMRIIQSGEQNHIKIYFHDKRILYPIVLLILVFLVLLMIELKHPYYFLQDDNRDQHLPNYIHNYNSLIQGELAIYNFHQYLGTPSLAIGQSATFYPFTYLSILLSSILLGHYFAAIDIMVILHLLMGALGFYRLMRFLEVDRKAAFFGGMTWPLSSFIIIVSNSWVIVSAVAAYYPWMLLLSFRLYKKPSMKNNIYFVLIRLLLFYFGHIQYFIYSVIFDFFTAISYVITDSKPGQKKTNLILFFKRYVWGYFYIFVLALPLLLPMWHQTTISGERSGHLYFSSLIGLLYPIKELWKDLIYPFSKAGDHKPWLFGNTYGISHVGYITLILLFIGISEKIIKKQKKLIINSVRLVVFTIPFILALLWSTSFLFNVAIYFIPIINRFRWPFKVTVFLNFNLIVITTLFLSHFISIINWRRVIKDVLFGCLIGIQVLNLLFLYIGTPLKAFGYHGDNLPLEEKLQDRLTDGRIISLGFDIWDPFQQDNKAYLTAPAIGFHYASIWGLDYLGGYDILITKEKLEACLGLNWFAVLNDKDPIPIHYLRKAGVKWYIVPRTKGDVYTIKFNPYGITKKYEDENRVVFYDDKSYPMIFSSNRQKISKENYKVITNTIELNIDNKQPEVITFNYMFHPFFEGFIDGKAAELMSINDIHFSISVPEGNHQITIRYKDPYFNAGSYVALAFLIFIIITFLIKFVWIRKKRAIILGS